MQHLNKDGYGYIVSMDVSDVANEPLSHCSPKVELYIQGAAVDDTRHVRGGWVELLVDCEGVSASEDCIFRAFFWYLVS